VSDNEVSSQSALLNDEATPGQSVTALLYNWRQGDEAARDRLMPLVYADMQKLARRELRQERAGHTLLTRDLVHEAYERLVKADVSWNDRRHFFAIAARTMRRVLVDHARARQAHKRGAGATVFSLDQLHRQELPQAADARQFDVLDIDEALTRLGEIDPRMEQAVELCFFAGMTHDEAAATIGSSRATVQRDLRFAKAWLRKYLENN